MPFPSSEKNHLPSIAASRDRCAGVGRDRRRHWCVDWVYLSHFTGHQLCDANACEHECANIVVPMKLRSFIGICTLKLEICCCPATTLFSTCGQVDRTALESSRVSALGCCHVTLGRRWHWKKRGGRMAAAGSLQHWCAAIGFEGAGWRPRANRILPESGIINS